MPYASPDPIPVQTLRHALHLDPRERAWFQAAVLGRTEGSPSWQTSEDLDVWILAALRRRGEDPYADAPHHVIQAALRRGEIVAQTQY